MFAELKTPLNTIILSIHVIRSEKNVRNISSYLAKILMVLELLEIPHQ